MALEKGLPAVPRGQGREMTAYLQQMHNVIAGIAGFGRNSGDSRAARVSEVRELVRNTGRQEGSITAAVIAAGSVTESKLANGAVSTAKLATGAVETDKITQAAVTRDKIADHAIGREKLDEKLLPELIAGRATHGETVELGRLFQKPLVAVTGQSVPLGICGELVSGIRNLREEAGGWRFDVEAAFEMDVEDGVTVYPGELAWAALVWRV